MITKYSNFTSELILEKAINESVIYFTPKLRSILKKTDSPISKELLEVEADDIKPDITFVGIDNEKLDAPSEPGYVTFITMKNAWKKMNNDGIVYIKKTDDPNYHKPERKGLADRIYAEDYGKVYSQSRNSLKIGKFVNKVLPGKYNASDIEKFTNQFKAMIDSTSEKFSIIEGDEIAKWYKGATYASGGGNLNNSCMRNRSASVFKIYTHNPQVCKMLILVEDGKLLGRAIIWKPESYSKEGYPEFFMDRIYATKDSDIDKFKNYAKEQGWAHKTHNDYNSFRYVTYVNKADVVDMTVKLDKVSESDEYRYNNFPYMDTFRKYDPETGILYNNDNADNGEYLLCDTNGGFESADGDDGTVYSEWDDCDINEDEAVYSDWADSYLHCDDAVNINGRWYPENCDDVAYSEWDDEYLLKNEAEYSEIYDSYIRSDSAVLAIAEIADDGDPEEPDDFHHENDTRRILLKGHYSETNWFIKLSNLWSTWDDYNYICKDLLSRDYEGNYILSMFSINVFRVVDKDDEVNEVSYLTSTDAKILGYELEDLANPKLTDKFNYNESLGNSLLLEIYTLIKAMAKDDDESEYGLKLSDRKSEIEDGVFCDEDILDDEEDDD